MDAKLDRETLKWIFRLQVTGAVLIGLYSIFDATPFLARAVGNLVVAASLFFLVDVDGGKRSRTFYFASIGLWLVVVIHSGFGFLTLSEQGNATLHTVTLLVYAFSWLAVVLFAQAMGEYSHCHQLRSAERRWGIVVIVSSLLYIIPFIAFLGAFAGSLTGAEIGFNYGGAPDTSPLMGLVIVHTVRAVFMIPPILVIWGIRKMEAAKQEVEDSSSQEM